MDTRFQHVLTPFEPTFRAAFCRALTKPSGLVLEACAVEMKRMRAAVDACYQRVERIRSEHLRITLAIKVAESKTDYDLIQPLSSGESHATNTSSATAHEAALKTWNRFLQYAGAAGDILHVGFLVVDQQKFIRELRDHVARHLAHMNALLPREYHALLQSLVDDVDARIDRVTKVPESLESAMMWIDQVSEMLPTHPQRQHFDAKCQNLVRLKALVKERAAASSTVAVARKSSMAVDGTNRENEQMESLQQHEQELEGSVRKLEVTWESLYETLLLCLERVQDRNSVHRRSLDELTSRTEEFIGEQLHQILIIFADLPTGIEEEPRPTQQEVQTQLVNRLEELVEMDMERWRVVTQYAEYEREYRMISELPSDQWVTVLGHTRWNRPNSLSSQGEKLPTEMLLQYIVTAFELRQWYAAWTALRTKWEALPVVQVHPGAIVDRIKQFRKRLMVSARRMNRLSIALLKTSTVMERTATEDQASPWGFAASDHQLVRAFRTSIESMAWLSKVFQAVNGGLFVDQHWEQLQGLLYQAPGDGEVLDRDRFALAQLLEAVQTTTTLALGMKVEVATGIGACEKMQALMGFFDDCIVESRLHAQLDRSRHRLNRVRVFICEENYSVRCDGIDEALRELDNILMDVKLCLYQQNPELQECVAMCAEVERLMGVCEYVSQFQRKWLPMFDVLKLHDVEEFVASQQKLFAASNNSSRQTETCGDSNAWKAFTSASQRWADCMRRIYFTRPQHPNPVPQSNATITLKSRSSVGKRASSSLADGDAPETEDTDGRGTSKKRSCSLDEIACGFQDFDFELEIASCEHGMALVRGYLSMLRDKSPRLLLVEDADLLRLLVHDQDVPHFHRVLTLCFPHASRFSIKRCSPHYDLELDGSAPTSDSVRLTDDATNSIVVDGLMGTRESVDAAWSFHMPVTKIGRIKFWLSRIEEEMAMMVRGNAKMALHWVMSSTALFPGSTGAERGEREMESSVTLPPARALLLPQSIAVAAVFRFSYEVAHRWLRAGNGDAASAIRRLDDLGRQQEATMNDLIVAQRGVVGSSTSSGHTPRTFANTENLLLLLHFQTESLRHITQFLRAQRDKDARFFWAMQYKVHLCQLSAAGGAPVSAGVAGGRQAARAERIDFPSDVEAAVHSMKRRDLEGTEMYAQVAHIELAIGHEFTGWSRVPILSPLSQRCAFALFSAVRAHKTLSMVAPYSHHLGDDMSTRSVVMTLTQFLMTPLLQMKCSPGTPIANGNLEQLEAHVDAAVALNAVLMIHDFALLSQPTQRLVHERLCHRSLSDRTSASHQPSGTSASTAISMGVRFNGGPPLPGPAVIIPFATHQSLHRSGLLDPIQHQFKSFSVPPVAIGFLVESLLLPHGYTHDQVMRTGAVGAFEALATVACDFEGKCGVGVRSIIPKVVGEAMRLCASYRVIFMPMLDGQHSPSPQAKNSKPSVATSTDDSTNNDVQERRIEQTAFRVALLESIELLLACGGCSKAKSKSLEQIVVLLDALFPYASQSKAALSLKRNDTDDAVANAVEICLEEAGLSSSTGHREQRQQLERIMELWKLLQVHDGVLIYGPTGSGKSTCIKILHRALTGLALVSTMSGEDAGNESPDSGRSAFSDSSKLTVVNADVLSLDRIHAEVTRAVQLSDMAQQQGDEPTPAAMVPPRWITVDGALDSTLLDRVMALGVFGELNNNDSDERDPAALVTRRLAQSVQAGGSQVCSPRIVFETTSLSGLSPFTLTRCASVYISATCVSYEAIVSAWKRQWQQRLCVSASTEATDQDHADSALTGECVGNKRLALLFKTIDSLLGDICIPFAELENVHQEQSKESLPLHSTGLGGLSLNHMTSTALTQLALWCFSRHQSWHADGSLLPSPAAITELAAFAVLWGFAGHMPHAVQHKLEFFLRAKLKDSLELRHLSDARGSLFDASRFDEWSADDGGSVVGDPWPMRPPSTSHFGGAVTEGSEPSRPSPSHSAAVQSVFDSSRCQLIVLQPVALPLVRVCTQLIHTRTSFMLVGPAASGKTSLLRWLLRANDDAQTAEMMVDRALDQRQAHGVLDWLAMPASWFASPTTASRDSSADHRVRAREENELFPPHSTCSFVFVDDLSVEDSSSAGSFAKAAFLRSILDHGACFSSQRGTFSPVNMQVGAAMRLDGDAINSRRQLPSAVTRLLRHFVVLHTPEYSQRDLLSVFRTKFNAHFDPFSRFAGPGAGGKHGDSSSTTLTAPEVVLRASADWMNELSALRGALRAQGIGSSDAPSNLAILDALTFNWHHLSVILARTLAFTRELSCISTSQSRDGTPTTTGSEPQTVTLVELGRLHQSWLSELQNVFLVNWPPPSIAPSSTGSEASPATTSATSISQDHDAVSKKLWAIVRLLSEKYFSAALQDERELPVSIASAYFSLRLTDTHTQAPLLQGTNTVELRDLLTALASSAPSVGGNARSPQGSVGTVSPSTTGPSSLVVDQRKPVAERIVTMLIEISRGGHVADRSASPRKLNSSQHHRDGLLPLPDDLELRLLLSSPPLLTQTLHVVHALGQSTPQSPLVVLSARHGLAIARRLTNFACTLHGFQVQKVGATAFEPKKRDSNPAPALARGMDGDIYAFLGDVLLAVGARHQRIALWVDWRDLSPAGTDRDAVGGDVCTDTTTATTCNRDAASLLVALIEEICLGQIPTLVLDQVHSASGATLRDAIVMGSIHDKNRMDNATEAQLLRDFCSRIKQNLRVCIFDSEQKVSTTPCSPAIRGRPVKAEARVHSLRSWMRTQSSCVWLQLDIKTHQLCRITSAMAEQAAVWTPPLPSGSEKLDRSSSLSVPRSLASISSKCLTALHRHIMAFANPLGNNGQAALVAPEHSVEYFLSFMVNFLTQWRCVLSWETSVLTRHRQAIERFDVLTSELIPRVAARLVVLDRQIRDLSEKNQHVDAFTNSVSPVSDQESGVNGAHDEAAADALAQLGYVLWCRRSEQEERDLMRCELEMERQTLALFMGQCQQTLSQATALTTKWKEAVQLRQTDQFWSRILGDTILHAANASYSFVWSLEGDYKTAHLKAKCVAGIKQILHEHELYLHDNASPTRHKDALFQSGRGGNGDNLHCDDSGEVTAHLARLLMAAELPLLRSEDVKQILRAGFTVTDRMPVFVDPTGIFQRLFSRCFSGQPLLGVETTASAHTRGSPLRVRQEEGKAPVTCGASRQSQQSPSHAPGFIVSCNAPDLRNQLAEAQRLGLPVLLVDFLPTDRLCAILSPFLDDIRRRSRTRKQLPPTPQPLGLLECLAVESYYSHAADRNSRRTNRRTASVTIGSATTVIGTGAAPRPSVVLSAAVTTALEVTSPASATTRSRRNSIDRRVDYVTALAATLSQQSAGARDDEAVTHQCHGKLAFQIVAVSTFQVDLSVQHQRSHEYAFYVLDVDKNALGGDFFARVWLLNADRDGDALLRGVLEAERQLVDCCALVANGRDKLWAAIDKGTSLQRTKLVQHDSLLPLASTASMLEYYGRVCDALVAISLHERRFETCSGQLCLKKETFDGALAGYNAAGCRIARLGRCLSVLPTLLPTPASILYKKSYRWLEYRTSEELATTRSADADTGGLNNTIDGMTRAEIEAADIAQRIATDVGGELISKTHQRLLMFLQSIERATRLASTSNGNDASRTSDGREQQEKQLDVLFLWQAMSFMSATDLVLPSSGAQQQRQQSHRQVADSVAGQSVNSLVDRFRRKVRLGAILVDCFVGSSRANSSPKVPRLPREEQTTPGVVTASPSVTSTSSLPPYQLLFQDARQRRRPFQESAIGRSSLALNAANPNQQSTPSELECVLGKLFTVVEEFWLDWKAAKLQRRRDVERLLAAHGFRRARRASLRHLEIAAVAAATASVSTSPGSTTVGDGVAISNSTVRVKSLGALLAEFNLYDQYLSTAEADGDVDSGRDSVPNSLAKLLLSYCFFPDQLAESTESWCEVVMPWTPDRRLHRQSSSGNGQSGAEFVSEQSGTTTKNTDQESFPRLLDFGTPSPALTAVISDISPSSNRMTASTKASKPPLVLLPKCLLVYTPPTDATAQHLAEKCLASMSSSPQPPPIMIWWRSAHQTPAAAEEAALRNNYDQLVALVTSTATVTPAAGPKQGRRFFAVNLLDPTHFDEVVAITSRVVNEHALLAAPEWIVVCSLSVAMRLTSSTVSLLPRVLVNPIEAVDKSWGCRTVVTKLPTASASVFPRGTTVDDRHAEAIAENLSWLQSGLAARDESERELMHATLMRCLSPQAQHQHGEGVNDDAQAPIRDCTDEWEDEVEQLSPTPSLLTSSAALSTDLATGIVVARHAILSIVHGSGSIKDMDASSPPRTDCNQVIQRIMALFDSLMQTTDALDAVMLSFCAASSSSEPQLFPWHSLRRELESQSVFIRALNAHFQAHLSLSSRGVDPTHSFTTVSLSRGLLPLSWIASALDHAIKSSQGPSSLPCWPVAQVSVAQAFLLLAYRFALLADWLSSARRRRLTRSLDLAGVHDARGLLRGLKQYFARRSGVAMRHVTLALIKDEDDEGVSDEDEEQLGLGAAIKQGDGSDVIPVGIRVEGIVLLELERSKPGKDMATDLPSPIVAFHLLPPCRLVCRIALDSSGSIKTRDDKDKDPVTNHRRIPLVVLASLSPYYSQSNIRSWTCPEPNDERIDWVELEIEPSAVGVSLQQHQQQNFDRDEGTDNDGVGLALGVPLFAADDDPSNSL